MCKRPQIECLLTVLTDRVNSPTPVFLFFSIFFGVFDSSLVARDAVPVWNQALAILNASSAGSSIRFTHNLNEDLLTLNEKEIAEIVSRVPKDYDRKAKNRFIHEAVAKLNKDSLSLVQTSNRKEENRSSYSEAAKSALKQISSSEITRPENILRFKDGDQIGFCFSRALLIHYLLLKAQVPQTNLAKIFMVGDLRVGGVLWKFHVAILINDPIDGLRVVDPFHEKWLSLTDWIRLSTEMDIKKPFSRVRFYITPPNKFLPSSGAYDLHTLQNPVLKDYSNAITSFF